MLVVIAVIGMISAVVIPNIGGVNLSSREVMARRNAQSLASISTAAQAAGCSLPTDTAATPEASIYNALAAGIAPSTGVFKGRQFIVPSLPSLSDSSAAPEAQRILKYLTWDATAQTLNYDGTLGGY
jgi:type II secretory pathway pseudopilin PulG